MRRILSHFPFPPWRLASSCYGRPNTERRPEYCRPYADTDWQLLAVCEMRRPDAMLVWWEILNGFGEIEWDGWVVADSWDADNQVIVAGVPRVHWISAP